MHMQRHFILPSSILFFLALVSGAWLLILSPSHAACPTEKAFADAFAQQQLQQLRTFAMQLNDCPEAIKDKRRYYIASALYQQLTQTIPEDKVTAKDYDEILSVLAYFWKAQIDLGDLSFKAEDYIGALNYYKNALMAIDAKEKDGKPVYTPNEEKIPASYILALKDKADNARLLASLRGHIDEPVSRDALGNPQGMYSFRIRGVDIKCHKYPIYFDYDETDIRDQDRQNAQHLYQMLHVHNDPDIELVGHTDEIGSDPYNDELSRKRAQRIKDYLIKERGYKGKVRIIGKGKREPVTMMQRQRKSLSDEQWRQRNRRVEACKQ